MFQISTKPIAALSLGVSLLCLPMGSFAAKAAAPAQSAQVSQPAAQSPTFQDIRRSTKAKVSETRSWVKNHDAPKEIKYFIDDMEKATAQLQDQVSPVGNSIKSFVKKKLPGKSVAHSADKSLTVFGILLILAFAFTLFGLNSVKSESRTGGRH